MKVQYFATLRKITGKQEEDIKARKIGDLLEIILNKYGEEFRKALYDSNGFRKGVIILKNGKNIIYLNNLETELEDTDTVSIFPPVAGG
ncbi:MAG: ubiquitin-like small modifier protein 1 [Thermoplasmata archaeon]|jgi:MoaD family protein, archaeal|nr:MoaD/ThiS family protein [Thermoplasmata archaeon]MVT13390.1 MoaD family protein [Euryarchaeota archaeon]MVT14138.1 MoaD family protein [Euryarchaeota archaeon]MVT36034.1 MoaD family protein [Euryarchaeota archaeon]